MRAERITSVGRDKPAARFTIGDGMRIGGAGLVLLWALAAALLGLAPAWVFAAYVMLGLVSLLVYGFDKRAARNGDWRVSLHGLDLIGGIAGGLLGQLLFRHKTRKESFVTKTVLIAALHLAALALLAFGVWHFPRALFFV
jgi:uncharacterized membrane protein YsdA (DUF1294 family)